MTCPLGGFEDTNLPTPRDCPKCPGCTASPLVADNEPSFNELRRGGLLFLHCFTRQRSHHTAGKVEAHPCSKRRWDTARTQVVNTTDPHFTEWVVRDLSTYARFRSLSSGHLDRSTCSGFLEPFVQPDTEHLWVLVAAGISPFLEKFGERALRLVCARLHTRAEWAKVKQTLLLYRSFSKLYCYSFSPADYTEAYPSEVAGSGRGGEGGLISKVSWRIATAPNRPVLPGKPTCLESASSFFIYFSACGSDLLQVLVSCVPKRVGRSKITTAVGNQP